MSLYRINRRIPGQDRTACRWCNAHCRISLHPRDRDRYCIEALATCQAGQISDYRRHGITASELRKARMPINNQMENTNA